MMRNKSDNYHFESYRDALRSFVARHLNDRQGADDVVQEIYKKLLTYPSREAILNPRAWLWRVAWRVVNDARTVRKATRAYIPVDPKTLEEWADRDTARQVSSVESQVEAEQELLEALEGLPVATQIAIVRSRRDGWTLESIARELGCSTHMVKKHIIRALAHFTGISAAKRAKRNRP